MQTDKLDRIFSIYIRLRDTKNGVGNCCTCGRLTEFNGGHCGHFISRRHQATRFNEKNCALQCVSCNTYNQGRQYEFGLFIDRKYGAGTAEKLLVESRQVCKRGKVEIDVMTEYYKKKVKELKESKKL